MAFTVIDIPGRPGAAEVEGVRIIGRTDELATIIVTYTARGKHPGDPPMMRGEITFAHVLEYRWVAFDYVYDDFPDYPLGVPFGLIAIADSRYVERMAALGPARDRPGRRFGSRTTEAAIRHYRLAFDDYGEFTIVARAEVSVRQLPA